MRDTAFATNLPQGKNKKVNMSILILWLIVGFGKGVGYAINVHALSYQSYNKL